MRDLVLKFAAAIIILGLFGLLVTSGLPDGAIIAVGFAVAVGALAIGVWVRPDKPGDPDR